MKSEFSTDGRFFMFKNIDTRRYIYVPKPA